MESSQRRVRFSIIIPTLKRQEILKEALALLEAQIDKDRDEIVIVIGNNGPAKARNEAIKRSRGKYLLFLNDDSFIEIGFIKSHLDFHSRHKSESAGMVGLTENHPETIKINAMKWLVGQSGLHFNYRFKYTDKIRRIPWYYLWTCNFSMKRNFVIKNELWFCEEFPTAAWEDIEFAYRAKINGLKLYFDSNAKVWHFHQLKFEDIKNRFISHGRGLYYLKSKLPVNFLPFLIKNKLGRFIILILEWRIMNRIRNIMEWIVKTTDNYPNIIMQWLVVKWKSDGYTKEAKKMSGM
ncbi:glycosyltransferase family 2 protein [Candidatus Shapirobacteria bacterium]|nr:glycosyltransferase family 2 protein [Candidatus Shapirobacteria bacterium]